MALPELVTGAIGIGQNIRANKLKRQADNTATPPLEDPNQALFLDKIQRRRKQIQQGVDPASTSARNTIKENISNLSSNVFKSGAQGNVIQQLMKDMSRSAGQQISQVASAQAGADNQLLNMEGAQTNVMAERSKNIQFWKKIQKMRESAELKTTANKNIGAALGSLSPKVEEGLKGLIPEGKSKFLKTILS